MEAYITFAVANTVLHMNTKTKKNNKMHTAAAMTAADEIASHIRKCCLSGIQHAGKYNSCDKYEYEVNTIPPLWRGLCHSTYGVCCSRKLEEQYCHAGRLAALRGSRCDEQHNTTAYADCCRACQVGLAVKASNNDCGDELFSYFGNIETYHVCCGDVKEEANYRGDAGSEGVTGKLKTQTQPTIEKGNRRGNGDVISEGEPHSDGTIVLPEDDDDICSKVPNLCQHICENTKEAYRCKCKPGYKLDDNNVTCTRISTGTYGDNVNGESVVDEDVADEEDIEDADEANAAGAVDTFEASTSSSGLGIADTTSKCSIGYEYNYMQQKCIDIDECAAKIDNCKVSQYCHNMIGGYHCLSIKTKLCEPGFQFNTELEKCEEKHTSHLGARKSTPSISENTFLGGATVQCSTGFQSNQGRCMDIDECALDAMACDSSQLCTNDIGGYHCDCKIGFNLDTTTNACVDINECSINNHNCLPTQRCDNTLGSYICTRLQSCGTGYTLNAETNNCDDDNECALETHNCPLDYECHNTKGSFRCYRKPTPTSSTTSATTITTTTVTTTTTPVTPTTTFTDANRLPYYYRSNRTSSSGYTYPNAYAAHQTYSQTNLHERSPHYLSGGPTSVNEAKLPACGVGFHRNHLGACVDMNECIMANPCGTHQRCINTNGSYRCQNLLQCAAGYKSTPDGTQCIDIDECETGEHQCAPNQLCRNRQGGYICSCPPGHHLSNGANRCIDVNECEQEHPSVCPSNAQCLNTIGSYYCECKSGFQKSKDNERICLDVDECQEIPGLCQQKCVNFWGGYRCTCNQGFELSADNRTCNDVDECEVHKSYKLCTGYCNNIPGSYECSCPRGYTLAMDKTTCRDIDECATGEFCTGRNDICTNIHGSYKCTTIHCPYGYVNDPDQKNRCRLSSNLCEGDECYNKPSAYTYNFITLVSQLIIPPEGRIIFSLRGPLWYDNIDFDLKILKIQAAANIEKASDNHFDTIKRKHEVHLQLKRSLEGPQDIELDLSMTVFTNGMPRGKSVAKIFILVSQYTF